jgi:hypothetical protein
MADLAKRDRKEARKYFISTYKGNSLFHPFYQCVLLILSNKYVNQDQISSKMY